MAGNRFGIVAPQQVVGLSTQTLVRGKSPTNVRVKIWGIELGFHGTVNTNEPITMQILSQTSSGTSTLCTPVKYVIDLTETVSTAGRYLFTAEGTPGVILKSFPVHPQTSTVYDLPEDDPLRTMGIPGGTWFSLRVVTPSNTVGVEATLKCEE